jgi:hypothetical protein
VEPDPRRWPDRTDGPAAGSSISNSPRRHLHRPGPSPARPARSPPPTRATTCSAPRATRAADRQACSTTGPRCLQLGVFHHTSAEMPSASRPFTAGSVTHLVSSGVLVADRAYTGVSSSRARSSLPRVASVPRRRPTRSTPPGPARWSGDRRGHDGRGPQYGRPPSVYPAEVDRTVQPGAGAGGGRPGHRLARADRQSHRHAPGRRPEPPRRGHERRGAAGTVGTSSGLPPPAYGVGDAG